MLRTALLSSWKKYISYWYCRNLVQELSISSREPKTSKRLQAVLGFADVLNVWRWDQITLEATLLSVDPGVGSMTINWDVLETSQVPETGGRVGFYKIISPPAVDIYFDEYGFLASSTYLWGRPRVYHFFQRNTLFQSDGSSQYFTNEKPAQPVFRFTDAMWDTQYANSASFQTRINLFPNRNRRSITSGRPTSLGFTSRRSTSRHGGSSSLRIYPFDT